jgi:hypothetical protein
MSAILDVNGNTDVDALQQSLRTWKEDCEVSLLDEFLDYCEDTAKAQVKLRVVRDIPDSVIRMVWFQCLAKAGEEYLLDIGLSEYRPNPNEEDLEQCEEILTTWLWAYKCSRHEAITGEEL